MLGRSIHQDNRTWFHLDAQQLDQVCIYHRVYMDWDSNNPLQIMLTFIISNGQVETIYGIILVRLFFFL